MMNLFVESLTEEHDEVFGRVLATAIDPLSALVNPEGDDDVPGSNSLPTVASQSVGCLEGIS
jgi:hypothetical protein